MSSSHWLTRKERETVPYRQPWPERWYAVTGKRPDVERVATRVPSLGTHIYRLRRKP